MFQAKNQINTKKHEYTFLISEATRLRIIGQYNQSKKVLDYCVNNFENPAGAYYQLSIVDYVLENIEASILNAEKAAQLEPDNKWYLYQLADLYRRTNNQDKTIAVYKKLLIQNPEKGNLYLDLANLQLEAGNIEDGLITLNKYEEVFGINEQVVLTKEKIYSIQKKYSMAIKEIEKLIKKNPYNPDYIGMLAELYLTMGDEEAAKRQFEKLFELDEDNINAMLSMASYYRSNNQYDKAFSLYKKAFSNDNMTTDEKIKETISFITNQRELSLFNDDIRELITIIENEEDEEEKVKTLKADYFLRLGEREKARDELIEVTKLVKRNYVVWEQLLLVERELGNNESLIKHADSALVYFDDKAIIYYLKGIALKELGMKKDAIATFKSGLGKARTISKVELQMLIQIAETYYDLEQKDSAYVYYDKSLEIEPGNINILNNYSYYLSEHGDDLGKAKQMIEKVISSGTRNPAYLDTYAWILYKMGNFEEALKFIELAYLNGGQSDSVIKEHYAEILFSNQMVDEAIEMMKSAIISGGDKERLTKRIDEFKN